MSILATTGLAQSGPNAEQRQLTSANTKFGFELLKQLARDKPEENIFISPYSVSCVLQMVSSGARGETQKELQQVLGTTGLNGEQMSAAFKQLHQSILAKTNVILNLANALWLRKGAALNHDFATIVKNDYQAKVGALDFASPGSAKIMNDWAAQATHGKITAILSPPIPAETSMILANAIYFKGSWLRPFDAKQTRPDVFHLSNGGTSTAPMMRQTRSFRYLEEPGFQAIELFYAGNQLSMEILLPATNSNLGVLIGQLDSVFWKTKVQAQLLERKGTLVFPRFSIRFGADLTGALGALGLKSALTAGADFSGMSSAPLYLSAVKHQSFVEVNEQGTEAAAVTTGIMALASMREEQTPFEMIVNRPFLFVIQDKSNGAVLFIGSVTKLD